MYTYLSTNYEADSIYSQIPGGVTAADGFQAAGLYGGLRAVGDKPDLALVFSTREAVVAGEQDRNAGFAGLVFMGNAFEWRVVVDACSMWIMSGTFTKNVVAAAPVIFCQNILAQSSTVPFTTFLTGENLVSQLHGALSLMWFWDLSAGSWCPHKCWSGQCCNGKELLSILLKL